MLQYIFITGMNDMGNDDGSKDYEMGLECYDLGIYIEAGIHFCDSAAKGYGPAFGYLGFMQLNGLGSPQSTKKAIEMFDLGVKSGDMFSTFMMCKLVVEDVAINYSKQQAVNALETLADQDYVYAIETIGWVYENDHSWAKSDKIKACRYFEKGVQLGSKYCMVHLSLLYYYSDERIPGLDFEGMRSKAIDYMSRAAELGDATAQYYMGEFLRNRDFEEAEAWYRKAMEQGDLDAMYRLGTLIRRDLNRFDFTTMDNEGMVLIRKAAESGHPDAMGHLAFILSISPPNHEVMEEAKRWAYKSMDANSGCGYYALATMYEFGVGVPESMEEAIRNYKKAADLGCEWGAERYDQLTNPESWN